ncbi:hypothetical protein M9458_039381 [Cirrhinus mrigala]|uniref:Uncharacterized protein n=1 Tax=Cirrhinus mrigala TaxID=683832 RepID=A0ABD0NNT7_CIRMR
MPPTVVVNMINIGKESALFGPAALPQLVSCEDSTASDVQAQLLNADPHPPACYAQQVAPSAPSAPLADLVDSELQPEAGDYGIVVPASFEPPSPYRTQGHTVQPVDACEDELDDEDQTQIFLDWSPETRKLKIPLMGLLGQVDEAQVQTEAVTLLPNVILRQSSEDSGESEDDFTKMERDWGLIIHSSPD